MRVLSTLLLIAFEVPAYAQGPENVLVVVNRQSSISRRIGDYYVHKRGIPLANLCTIDVSPDEEVSPAAFERNVAAPISAFLRKKNLQEKILYLVTTLGVPLRVSGAGQGMRTEFASVDSELTGLYARLNGNSSGKAGPATNPFYAQRDEPFRHPNFPMYLVTRLAGYDFDDVRRLIDRSLVARNRGNFVIDLRANNDTEGNSWLRAAATLLPKDRVVLDDSATVLYGHKQVIGYASWGSNDPDRKTRTLGFEWLPGAVMTEFVSTNARTFARPPASWTLGTWKDTATWFAGAPQTLIGDYIHEGVTGCSGHVTEPFLHLTPRPDYLLPAYYSGRNLAESYYMSIPALSWQNIVVGDPLCKLGKP
ncbi:MAG: TIGR03790 family protein [Acidobacteriota bacterium]|nr:TIGR03790 family protein [Acidobacteriota bacterium]